VKGGGGVDAVLEKLMHRADKELRRARRKHPQFAGENGFEEKGWPAILARFRKRFPEPSSEDVILEEECLEFLADVASGRREEAVVEAAQVVAVLVRILSEGAGR
jgi:hypothetical protein